MAELSDSQKVRYFKQLIKTLTIIRDSATKPVFGEQVTMRFIRDTANDMLSVLEGIPDNDTPRDC